MTALFDAFDAAPAHAVYLACATVLFAMAVADRLRSP